MKKFVLFVFTCLLGVAGLAQPTFNIPFDTLIQLCPPDSNLFYLFADSGNSTSYTYDTIPYHTESVGGTSINMSDDQVQGPFNIGFTFSFYCGQYTQFYICSNGWIGFSNGQTATWVVQSIPSTANNTPKNCIMGPWRDWNPASGNGPYVTYQTVGTAPLRKLIVTWSAVPMYSCTSTFGTFQIVLHEASNIIHNNLTNVPVCFQWGGGDGTEGTHNAAGNAATAVNGRNDSQFTVTNQSIRFIPSSPITWTTFNGNTINIGNGIGASFNSSQWVYASGYTCNSTPTIDSVYVAVSCIQLKMDSVDVACTYDSTGTAVAVDTSAVTGGPYTFYWTDVNGDTVAIHNSPDSIDTLENVPAGYYTAFAFGSNGEFAVGTVTVNEPPVVPGFTTQIPVLCNGDSTGKAIASDTNTYSTQNWNGTFDFWWSNTSGDTISSTLSSISNTDTVNGVSAGTYYVTIDGCLVQVDTVEVTEPPVLTASISNSTTISCPGVASCDGAAQSAGAGGVSPYSFLWTSNEMTQAASGLCAGMNIVTVTDFNQCTAMDTVIIGIPDSIVTQAFGDTLMCITNFAAINATSIGGTAPYSYVWTPFSLNDTAVSLNASDAVSPDTTTLYFVSSTDANGCSGDTASIIVKVRPPLGLELPHVDTICPYDTIPLTVSGLGGDSLYTFAWGTGSFGPTAFVSPNEPRWITVTVSDLCGTPTYTDSIFVQVGGYSPIEASVRVEDDSLCVGENVYLIASGRGGFRGPEEYRFEWSVGSWDGNPIQFATPLKTTDYLITITDLCLSEPGYDTLTVHVGSPSTPKVHALPTVACAFADVTLSIDSAHENYTYDWMLGDGDAAFNLQTNEIEHAYSEPGCYDVSLAVTTNFGCYSEQTFECLIQILEAATSSFTHDPLKATTLEPFIEFVDKSDNAETIQWLLNGDDFGDDSLFKHEFIDTGRYQIDLIAVSPDGCADTTTKWIENSVVTTIYIPGSFSPNGDGLNDEFKVVGEGIDLSDYEMEVFDRWGNTVFYSKNPDHGWDGKMIANGEYAPMGSYAYIVRYIDRYGEQKKLTGHVLISKSGQRPGSN